MAKPAINQDRILAKLQVSQKAALSAVADIAIQKARNFTPIWRGDLRRDIDKVPIAADTIEVVQSPLGSKSTPYAAYQYFDPKKGDKNLRHAGSLEKLEALTQFDPKKSGLTRGDGKKYAPGDANIYSRAYRWARKPGQIKKLPPPKWFTRIINDEKILRQMFAVYRKFWKLEAPQGK